MDAVAGTRAMSTSTPLDSSTSRIPRQWEIWSLMRKRLACLSCRVRDLHTVADLLDLDNRILKDHDRIR